MTAPFIGPRKPYFGVCARCEERVVRYRADARLDRCDAHRASDMRAAWRARNPGLETIRSRDWVSKHPEQSRQIKRRWLSSNLDRRKQVARSYYQRNADKYRAFRRRRGLAMPAWADRGAIAMFYRIARRISKCTGIAFEVDHRVPVNGRTVCGLHVQANLQVIARAANRKKWAHFAEAA